MSDVSLLSGISGLSLGSPFLSPLLFFCLVPLLFPSWNFCTHFPDLSRKLSNIFSQQFVCVCVRACVRACVCVRACLCVFVCLFV